MTENQKIESLQAEQAINREFIEAYGTPEGWIEAIEANDTAQRNEMISRFGVEIAPMMLNRLIEAYTAKYSVAPTEDQLRGVVLKNPKLHIIQ